MPNAVGAVPGPARMRSIRISATPCRRKRQRSPGRAGAPGHVVRVAQPAGQLGVRRLPVGDVEVAHQHHPLAGRDPRIHERLHVRDLGVAGSGVPVQRQRRGRRRLCRQRVRHDDGQPSPAAEVEPRPQQAGSGPARPVLAHAGVDQGIPGQQPAVRLRHHQHGAVAGVQGGSASSRAGLPRVHLDQPDHVRVQRPHGVDDPGRRVADVDVPGRHPHRHRAGRRLRAAEPAPAPARDARRTSPPPAPARPPAPGPAAPRRTAAAPAAAGTATGANTSVSASGPLRRGATTWTRVSRTSSTGYAGSSQRRTPARRRSGAATAGRRGFRCARAAMVVSRRACDRPVHDRPPDPGRPARGPSSSVRLGVPFGVRPVGDRAAALLAADAAVAAALDRRGRAGPGGGPAAHTRSVTPSTISPASSSGRARNRIVDSPPVTQGSTPASSIAPASAESISTARRRALSAVTSAVSHPRSDRPAR